MLSRIRSVEFDQTDSTNTQARRLAAEFPGEAIFVSAAFQSAGRGRESRIWQSPRGGAWFSLVWPGRAGAPPGKEALAPVTAAVAIRDAVLDLAPELADRLRIKWPNDLLVDDFKLAGILCEQILPDKKNRTLIIGVGVNVDNDPLQLVGELRRPATSIAASAGREIGVGPFLEAARTRLQQYLTALELGDFDAIVADYARSLAFLGESRTLQIGAQRHTGILRGVDEAGRLILETPAERLYLSVGEIVEPAP